MLTKKAYRQILVGFVFYSLIGAILLSLPVSRVQEISFVDNVFTSVSSVSTTGLTLFDFSTTYTFFGQLVMLILIQIGGLGYMTIMSFLIYSLNSHLGRSTQRVLRSEFPLPQKVVLRKFIKTSVVFTLVVELIGIVVLFIGFNGENLELGDKIWYSVFHSISAFCTAGVSLENLSIFADNHWVIWSLSALSILGSFGFIIVYDLWQKIVTVKHKISFTSKVSTVFFLILLISGTILILLTEQGIHHLELPAQIKHAFFHTVSSLTTSGFNLVPMSSFSLSGILLLLFLMYVGASPTGTGGGMKITTFVVIISQFISRLRKTDSVILFNRSINSETIRQATAVFVFYTFIIFSFTYLLSIIEQATFQQIIFEVSSALGTVGLSLGITAELTDFSKLVLSILMIVGRVGVLTFGSAVVFGLSKHSSHKSESLSI